VIKKRHALFLLLVLHTSFLTARPYVTCFLNGQLGNQLHQVSAALCLALDNEADAVFPEFRIRTDVGIPENYKHVFWRINTDPLPTPVEHIWREPKHTYVPIKYMPNMKLIGHYQSYKYSDKHRDLIVSLFSPSDEILEIISGKYQSILEHPCTVAIHLRTYHKEDPGHANFAKCGYSYFKKAVQLFPNDARFLFFSDDIKWCKKQFENLAKDITFIEGNPHYIDFYLISLCKHQIISYSTFSWWAAYLNTNPNKKVVAPQRWFVPRREYDNKEIVPEDWVVIDNLNS